MVKPALSPSRRSRLLPALVGSLLCLGAAPGAAQRADPPAVFGFLAARGEVAAAMARLWSDQFEALGTRDASGRFQARLDAEAVVRGAPGEAVPLLLEALASLDPRDAGGHATLIPLLRLVADDRQILAHFHALLMATPEPPREVEDEAAAPGDRLVRTQAMGHVVAAAEQGSVLAREALLDLLSSPDVVVRARAVRGLHRVTRDRLALQQELRRRLGPDDHYLIYRFHGGSPR